MRYQLTACIMAMIVGLGALQAQEQVPLPPPDLGAPDSSHGSASGPLPGAPEPIVPPSRDGQLPGTFVPPPPPSYPPYSPPPLYMGAPPPVLPGWSGDRFVGPEIWVGVQALVWWVKDQPLSVPIVTTGPASQGASAGGLGVPGTTSLTSPLDFDAEAGVRLFLGAWFNPSHSIGFDGSLFFLGRETTGFSVIDNSGTGQLVINEPVAGAPFVTQVSAPGLETGGVTVHASTEFGGGDINLLCNILRTDGWTVNLHGGFRYLELDEALDIHAFSTLFVTTTFSDNLGNVLATAPPGSGVDVFDHFSTHNYFYGGQIGAEFEHPMGRWFVRGVANLALGVTREIVTIGGSTLVSPTNATPVVLSGGNFATIQSGRFATDHFAVAPEVEASLGYRIGPHLSVSLGYDFTYLSSVVRPGDQIDNTFDGVVHPLVPLARSSFWATGLNVSMQLAF